LTIEG